MNLLVNATSVGTVTLTGIERFSLRISQELYRIDPNTSVVSTQVIPGIPNVSMQRLLNIGKRFIARKEYLLRTVWDQTVFRYIAVKSKADVVLFPIQDGMLFPPAKQIVTVHDLHYLHFKDSVSECRQEIPAHRRFFYRLKMPHILRSSAAIIAVSEATKHDIIEAFDISPDKVHVIYNGYDSSRFHLAIDSRPILERLGLLGKDYFLYVGSILRHKNLVRLVQAFSCQNLAIMLVIAGVCKDSDYLAEVMNVVSAAGLDERVVYLDYINDNDLPALYAGARALALPSLHEGFGVPIIEAMACGVPVVTSNRSSMPEVAGDAALFVDPYSVESIATAMNKIISDPTCANELRLAGLKRVDMFRWSNSAQKLYDLCKMVSES